MTTTQMTQTDEDYMPVYISIYDRPKRPVGRPKNKIQLTEEEKKERMRELASKHYYENLEKRRLQQKQHYTEKIRSSQNLCSGIR